MSRLRLWGWLYGGSKVRGRPLRSGFAVDLGLDRSARAAEFPVPVAVAEHRLGLVRQRSRFDVGDGLVHGVFDPLQLDAIVLDHGVGGPGIAVAGISNATRI